MPARRAPVPYCLAMLMATAADLAVAEAVALEPVVDAAPEPAPVEEAVAEPVADALDVRDAEELEEETPAEPFLAPQVTDWQPA